MNIDITKTQSPKAKPSVESLGFGKYFSDHMLTATFTKQGGWQDVQITPYRSFELEPGASVLHYGQALFEGMKAFRQENGNCVLFRPEFNWERMSAGAERLCMQMPPKDLFLKCVHEIVRIDQDWIPHKKGASLYIRPTLIGTESFLGVRPSDKYLFFIILSPVSSYYAERGETLKIWVEENYLRAAPGGLGATKAAANYAASLKAAYEAKKNGFAQVLWLDSTRTHVEEVGTMNVFFVFENEIVTPSLDGTILKGGMRDSTIQILKSWKKTVVERQVDLKEIIETTKNGKLKEVFGTGTAAVISPVGELASKNWNTIIGNGQTGLLTKLLYDELTAIQYGQKPDTFHWLTPI